MNAGPRVRLGEVADRDYVRDLGQRTVMASVSRVRPAPERALLRALERLYDAVEAQSHVVLIAECDGLRCGFLVMLDELQDEVTGLPQAFVAYMAVEEDRRRSGVGAALLEAAEDEARRRGLPAVTLMVTEENVAARRLYDRHGFVTERRLLAKPL